MLSRGGAVDLRDFLLEMYPLQSTKSDLDDVRKYALNPVKPMRGDIVTVTVVDFDGPCGVGKPHVVLDHVSGFEFLNHCRADGSITAVTSFSPSATVLLGHKTRDGVTTTQVAPVQAIRP